MNRNKSTDRRYRRTHEAILHAAIELALVSGWEKVSVTKLAERADLNRNSFYLHFGSINDVFDEIEDRFLSKYREFLSVSPPLDIMVRDSDYHAAFSGFLESEEEHVLAIKNMGRADHLISKAEKIWMNYYHAVLSSTAKYSKAQDIILPYVSGCTLIFFTNWINDPKGFDIRKNTLFSGDFIDRILSMESETL